MRTRVAALLAGLALVMPVAAYAQLPLPHPSFGLIGAVNVAS